MQTLPKQTSLFTEEQLTCLPEDSPASHIALLESGSEKKMSATSGRKCLEQLEKFNRVGLWAKTFSALLIGMEGWYSTRCKLNWKLKGTKYNRLYFQLVPSTLPTEEIVSGLLPTPQAIDGNGKGRELRLKTGKRNPEAAGSWRGDLKDYATLGMLPTPTASTGGANHNSSAVTERGHGLNLLGAIQKINQNGKDLDTCSKVQKNIPNGANIFLPTPMSSDCGDKVTGLENQDSLTKRVRQMTGQRSQLNPLFVMEMMGFPPDWTLIPFLKESQGQEKPILSEDGEMNQSKPEETL